MKIFCLPISTDYFDKNTQLLNFVSKERKNKIEKYRCDKDKQLSLYAALLVRMQLSKICCTSPCELSFFSPLYGKPICRNMPQYDFSISHTGSLIFCAITKDSKVGADAEKIAPFSYDIIMQNFHNEEKEFFNSLENDDLRYMSFYKMWTMKEAYSKYLGTGLSDSILMTNTLSDKFLRNIVSFKYTDCICSVYTEPMTAYTVHELTELDISDFFSQQEIF